MTPSPESFPDLAQAGEHTLPASFFDCQPGAALWLRVLVGEGDASVLSDEEQRRVETFGSEKRRREFVRGRTLLRRTAAERVGTAPQDIDLRAAPGGGLLPLADRWHLSLTHTADLAAVVLSESPVGLDAEHLQPMPERLAGRILAPGEALPDVADALLHLWTAKEAVLKARGEGLRGGLQRVRLDWEDRGQGLLIARARVGEAHYSIAVRCYCNTHWALAVQET